MVKIITISKGKSAFLHQLEEDKKKKTTKKEEIIMLG
jgi:hypothetical protein